MKHLYVIGLPIVISMMVFGGCKKKNQQLAQSHYKLSMLELSDDSSSDVRYKKALDHIDKALAQDDKPEYLALKATILFKLNQIEESLFCFKQSLNNDAIDPLLKPEVMNNYACVLAHQGKTEEAVKIWQTLMHDKHYLTPEVALVNQGKVSIEKGDCAAARDLFSKAVTIEPSYLDAHYYLALAAFQLQETDLAKNEVKTVLFLEPRHTGALRLGEKLGFIHTT